MKIKIEKTVMDDLSSAGISGKSIENAAGSNKVAQAIAQNDPFSGRK
jgi:hypothetical protein